MSGDVSLRSVFFLAFYIGCVSVYGQDRHGFSVEVLAEEDVYDFVSPDNGSGPLWSYGCSPITRVGDDVIISQMETGENEPRLSNTRWRLLRRAGDGWERIAEADLYRQREPTLLATLSDSRIYLNVNDLIEPPGTLYGRTKPHLLFFDLASDAISPVIIEPEWNAVGHFTDHSYRSFAADRENAQLLMFNIDARTSVQHWCLMDANGTTLRNGEIVFPIRATYPQTALVDQAAHILAIGNIVEPVSEWRDYKFEQTGREWDYVFRVLYYSMTPNIEERDFGSPIEIANVDATGGRISNHDLWIAPDGTAYILYSESETASQLMRDKFFPDRSFTPSLRLAVVKDGAVVDRRVLIEGSDTVSPGTARFHAAPSGTVYALMYVSGSQAANLLMQVFPLVDDPPIIPVPFQRPFTGFLMANVRAGNALSYTMDLVGHRGGSEKVSYGQVVIHESVHDNAH